MTSGADLAEHTGKSGKVSRPCVSNLDVISLIARAGSATDRWEEVLLSVVGDAKSTVKLDADAVDLEDVVVEGGLGFALLFGPVLVLVRNEPRVVEFDEEWFWE